MNPLFLAIFTLLFLILTTTTTTATATPTIGVTYDTTTPNLPPLDSIVTALIHTGISSVRLINPTPTSINAFSSTNINLIISIPNTLLHSFSENQSSSFSWLENNVVPFHHTTRISIISIDSTNQITPFHLPALRNLYSSLLELGIVNVKVSTTLHFQSILVVKDWLVPSQSEFYPPELIRSLVRFLKSTDSPFLVTLYPYDVYTNGHNAIPLQFAVFQGYRFNIRTDVMTGIEYWNLFDMMVDALVFALGGLGEGHVPAIVAETGWPCETIDVRSHANMAPVYLNGLMKHLKSGTKIGVEGVYIYELFGDEWGIFDEEMSLKYDLDFSGFGILEVVSSEFMYKMVLGLWVCIVVLLIVILVLTKNDSKVLKVQ